ncbi:DUF4760 domain-containing protein [Flammeovirga agarivorans]|uniref:DUF4760 domain-containing protein n=1 Tax=Flammeovirga agarivorans TaxID=2726742 RepID=A0A7X8SK21_9BACT|nr:DUF4760 domain-containing protein [Flammeovirga agarivorans]NLR91678.1 DUF4760 domain-containing protein [Flammeovirga agarivorans]
MIIIITTAYYYILSSRKKEKELKKKETVNFFFSDKINYEKVIIDKRNGLLDDEDSRILEILSVFEKMSISIKTKVYDEEVILEYYGKYMIHFFKEFKFFILIRREKSGNPYLFIEYEKLVNRINKNDKSQNYYE